MAVNGGRERRRCSVSDLAGGELELEPGNERGNKDVWKVSRSGASSMEDFGAPYIGRGGGHQEMAEVVVRRRTMVKAGRGGFGGLAGVRGCPLWCCHERAGVLDRAEERQRDGGSGLFLLLSSMSHGRVWAGVRGRRHQDSLGEAGTLWEGQRGGWLLVLVPTCTFADFCPPSVC
jgi:hypothetical protein